MRKLIIGVMTAGVTFGSFGCASKTGTGALVGAAGGAAIGGAIGSAHGKAGKGAVLGALVGAAGGAIVGNGMDQADKDRELQRLRDERDARYERRRYDDRGRDSRANSRDDDERYED